MTYSPEKLLSLWKKGISLDEAVWQYTDNKIREKYENITVETEWDDQSFPQDGADREAAAARILGKLRKSVFQSINKEAGKKEMWDNLFDKLSDDQLIGLGHATPVKSNHPTLIPLHMWPPEKTNAVKSSVSAHGIEYVRVRIIRKSAANKIIEQKKSSPPNITVKDKKVGRPSLKSKIISAYDHLWSKGRIDLNCTLKSHSELIQQTVMQLFPEITNVTGLGHEAIRRAAGERFKADRATSKSTSKL